MPILTNVPSSPYLEFQTLDPNTKGVLFSGIEECEFHLNDADNIHNLVHTVNLGYPATDVTQATITIGLASIYNGGSHFLFATDSAELCIDPNTGELQLLVSLALMGDPANLSRFGYQIAAIVSTTQAGISGTISFPADLFGATPLTVSSLKQLFVISANTIINEGGGGFGQNIFNPVSFGTIVGVTNQAGTVTAAYSIPSPPYNTELTVLVTTSNSIPQGSGFSQTLGPPQVTLTVPAPFIGGINFTYFAPRPIK